MWSVILVPVFLLALPLGLATVESRWVGASPPPRLNPPAAGIPGAVPAGGTGAEPRPRPTGSVVLAGRAASEPRSEQAPSRPR